MKLVDTTVAGKYQGVGNIHRYKQRRYFLSKNYSLHKSCYLVVDSDDNFLLDILIYALISEMNQSWVIQLVMLRQLLLLFKIKI